jgi:hypothetical protein
LLLLKQHADVSILNVSPHCTELLLRFLSSYLPSQLGMAGTGLEVAAANQLQLGIF